MKVAERFPNARKNTSVSPPRHTPQRHQRTARTYHNFTVGMQTAFNRKFKNSTLSNLPQFLSRDSIVYQKSQYLHCDPCKCLALHQNDHANRRPNWMLKIAVCYPGHIHVGWASTTNTPKNIHHHNAISSFCTFGGQFVVVLIVCECPH